MKNNVSTLKKEECSGCHACYNACSAKAIQMVSDEEGFLYPHVIEDKCLECGNCIKKCPAIHSTRTLNLDTAYACYAKDHNLHMQSSSGAVFALLANEIILQHGVVCGAAFDKDMKVVHLCVSDTKELKKLKTTKYVQSEIGSVYSEIKKYLEGNSKVLFAGTPCQVAGLKSFLGQEYAGLLTVDLICHGVPSPEVWKKYLSEIADGVPVSRMTFRNKEKGIEDVTLDYTLANGSVIKEKYGESPYIKGFISNLYLRPSCYHCKFKGIQRCSDITIGDFWGVKEYHSSVHNPYGTSAVIVHSITGKEFFDKIYHQLEVSDAKPMEIANWNRCLLEAVKEPEERAFFFVKWQELRIKDVVESLLINENENPPKKEKKLMEAVRKWLVSLFHAIMGKGI